MVSSISNLVSNQTGVNSAQLVNDLVAATREAKQQPLISKQSLNQARISALANASSALNTFSTALSELLDGRKFAGELVSSRGDLASVAFLSGKLPEGLPATVEITQLASSQRVVSGVATGSDAAVGEGTLTLATGSTSVDIVIDSTNNTLAGLRDAINASASGVTATILTDKNGSRLVLEGAEGLDNSFTLTGSGGAAALDSYAYPPAGGNGMTQIAAPADSIVKIDGIELVNSSNQLDNVISGVRLNLLEAAPGTTFTISGDQPVTSISDLVSEFVTAYNDLKTALNAATAPGTDSTNSGPLAGNSAVRDMVKALGRMSSTVLRSEGPYNTLADIGVKTNRDGTLAIDSTRLNAVLEADPLAVSRMLDPPAPDDANPGLAGTLDAIKQSLQSETGSLTLAQKRLEDIGTSLAEALAKADDESERYRAQLETQFQAMDRQLSILKSTQSYLDQQIAVWSNSNN